MAKFSIDWKHEKESDKSSHTKSTKTQVNIKPITINKPEEKVVHSNKKYRSKKVFRCFVETESSTVPCFCGSMYVETEIMRRIRSRRRIKYIRF